MRNINLPTMMFYCKQICKAILALSFVCIMMSCNAGETSLIMEHKLKIAICNNDSDLVKRILSANPNINIGKNTPLVYSLKIRNVGMALDIIDMGADVNQPNDMGLYPIDVVIVSCYSDMLCEDMIMRGLDINRSGVPSLSPLALAIRAGNINAAKYLITKGAVLKNKAERDSSRETLVQYRSNINEMLKTL